MATWNSGVTWNSGILWGPAAAPASQNQTTKKHKTMKRQPFWPKIKAQQPLWLRNWANQLEAHGPTVGLAPATITSHALDARNTAYALGEYNTAVREFGPAVSEYQNHLCYGAGGAALALPVFVVPTVPAAPAAVPAGALNRIFALCAIIKKSPGYTVEIGLQMGIVGEEDTAEATSPDFNLKAESGTGCQCVRIVFNKHGEEAVIIEERRAGGAGGFLAVDSGSPYLDERPLLVAGQPEVREYRMRFYADNQGFGEWTPWKAVTVGP